MFVDLACVANRSNPQSMEEAFRRLKCVLAGSGSAALSDARIVQNVLDLVSLGCDDEGREMKMQVLYLGTASYDKPEPKEAQTAMFRKLGCEISSLEIATQSVEESEVDKLLNKAHILVFSGGNTLFAYDRAMKFNLRTKILNAALNRGLVLAGGSAGAIIWFIGGHSDSADPATFLNPPEESSKDWNYLRTPGFGFFPGLLCPHHDQVQSNGIPRSKDFDQMMLRHSGERGICLDHWCAISFNEGSFEIISLDDKPGSLLPDGSFSPDGKGKPAVWIKDVVNGELISFRPPDAGSIDELLRVIVQDPAVNDARKANPSG